MKKASLLTVKEAKKATEVLEKKYRNTKYYLNFSTPVDLVSAAILSAQTRDKVVNKVTVTLFKKFKKAKDYANAKPEDLMKYVKEVSFAKNKVRNMINTFKVIENKYKGKVPKRKEDLVELPGIGEKTANTILINAFNIVEGIPVDTWVIKLSYRIGFSLNKNPDKIEKDLKKFVNKKYWHNFAYILKAHGKEICNKIPKCSICPISNICKRNDVTKTI